MEFERNFRYSPNLSDSFFWDSHIDCTQFLFSSFLQSKFARWLTIVLSVLFLVFVFFAWISNLVSQSMQGYDVIFNECIRDRLRWISKRIKKFWRIVSPPGV